MTTSNILTHWGRPFYTPPWMRICGATLFFVWFSFTQFGFAQCGNLAHPAGEEIRALYTDTHNILDLYTPKTGDDFLIVPGKRAGSYEIESGISAIKLKGEGSPLQSENRKEYSDILPGAYVPDRKFMKMKDESIEVAFSDELKLREIWVTDEKYETSEGVRVGGSKSSLERVSGLVAHPGRSGTSYFQGDGITFVVQKEVITKIIVRAKD